MGLGQLVTPEVKDASGAVTQAAVYDGIAFAGHLYSGMGVAQAMGSGSIVHGGALVGNTFSWPCLCSRLFWRS